MPEIYGLSSKSKEVCLGGGGGGGGQNIASRTESRLSRRTFVCSIKGGGGVGVVVGVGWGGGQ